MTDQLTAELTAQLTAKLAPDLRPKPNPFQRLHHVEGDNEVDAPRSISRLQCWLAAELGSPAGEVAEQNGSLHVRCRY